MLYGLQRNIQNMSFGLCGKHWKRLLKIMEQHFQDLDQKVQHDENLDTFEAHFAQYFNQKPTPQQCHEIMSFWIIYMLNPIGLMKTCGKS